MVKMAKKYIAAPVIDAQINIVGRLSLFVWTMCHSSLWCRTAILTIVITARIAVRIMENQIVSLALLFLLGIPVMVSVPVLDPVRNPTPAPMITA